MARALTFSGQTSQLNVDYFPAIDLSDGEYVCGLVDFQTFNSIPNIDETNNLFFYGYADPISTNEVAGSVVDVGDDIGDDSSFEIEAVIGSISDSNGGSGSDSGNSAPQVIVKKKPLVKRNQPLTCIQIPTGSYEVVDLWKYLKKALRGRNVELILEANKNTLQCEIMCSQPIDFTKSNTIGPLLGFRHGQVLEKNIVHVSELPADILKVNVIRIECSIINGSYLNGKPSHSIHEFSPRVPPGYKIIEVPQNVIYFPVTVKNIHTISLSIVDQQNRLINFRGETITIRLHIKKSDVMT